MIPEFDPSTGALPPGNHQATLEQIGRRLGFTPRRQWLLRGLRAAVEAFWAAGIQEIYVDGSFCTEKPDPGDIDGYWVEPDEGVYDRIDPYWIDFELVLVPHVRNPPFAGMNTIIEGNAAGYLDWLKFMHAESHGNSDLAAHFFRRAFTLLKPGGCFGLIATNTIGQGDTRSTGLRWICGNGGLIYRARKRYRWPGQAAVVVSVVHVAKGSISGPFFLDGRLVPVITAYLFHAGGHEDPARLEANAANSITCVRVLGMGFTFANADGEGIATPVSEMERLIRKDPRNKERIFPFLGGEELNSNPAHEYERYIINFADWPLRRTDTDASWRDAKEAQRKVWLRKGEVPSDYLDPVAADYPDLLDIVEQKVKPERDRDNRPARRLNWWKYGEIAPGFFEALRPFTQVLANSQVSAHLAFAFLPSKWIFAHTLNALLFDRYAPFSVLQSRVHEVWARFMASTLEDRLRYTPSDCFETFPFPVGFETHQTLESAGQAYYDFRAALMVRSNEGLTKTYNRFHDPGEMSHDSVELRRLHGAMDRAVLDAYGWTDVQPECEFFPEFDDEHEDEDEPSRKKRRFRYRWPDETRDDVLARLLVLNQQRYEEEVLAGIHDKAAGSRGASRRKSAVADDEPVEDQGELDL